MHLTAGYGIAASNPLLRSVRDETSSELLAAANRSSQFGALLMAAADYRE
jgi:hypothetical protein